MPFAVHATDEGLYDPVAPKNSAFFRFLNADHNAGAITPQANGRKYRETGYKSLTPYYVLLAGKAGFTFGGKKIVETLAPGKFYTVTTYKGQTRFMPDKPLQFRAKSLLSFYNMTEQEKLTLKLAEQDINIIDAVAAGQSGFREINPVTLTMAIFDKNNKKIADIQLLTLERGSAYTIAAFEREKGKLEFEIVRNTTDTKI
ncbi:MAG: alginate O-acetyltransferase AlgF [Alphaproteobacteria bacterium]